MVAEHKDTIIERAPGANLQLLEEPLSTRAARLTQELTRDLSFEHGLQIPVESLLRALSGAVTEFVREQTIHKGMDGDIALIIQGVMSHEQLKWFMNEAAIHIASSRFGHVNDLEAAIGEQLTFVLEEADGLLESIYQDPSQISQEARHVHAIVAREQAVRRRHLGHVTKQTVLAQVLETKIDPTDAPDPRHMTMLQAKLRKEGRERAGTAIPGTPFERLDLRNIHIDRRARQDAAVAALQAKYKGEFFGPGVPAQWQNDIELPEPEAEVVDFAAIMRAQNAVPSVHQARLIPRGNPEPRKTFLGGLRSNYRAAVAAALFLIAGTGATLHAKYQTEQETRVHAATIMPAAPAPVAISLRRMSAAEPVKQIRTPEENRGLVANYGNPENVNCTVPFSTLGQKMKQWGGWKTVLSWVDTQPELKGATVCDVADSVQKAFPKNGDLVAQRILNEASFVPEMVQSENLRRSQIASAQSSAEGKKTDENAKRQTGEKKSKIAYAVRTVSNWATSFWA